VRSLLVGRLRRIPRTELSADDIRDAAAAFITAAAWFEAPPTRSGTSTKG